MSLAEWFGFFGGLLVTLSLIPQIVRIFKLKSAREISLLFNTLMLIGLLFWLAYGVLLGLLPVIMWNTIGTVLVLILLYAKLKYGRKAGVG